MNQSDNRAAPSSLIFAGRTDVGRRRAGRVNQDRFVAVAFDTPAGPATLLAVADGMGGAAGGEVASGHAVDELVRIFNEAPPGQSDSETLYSAIITANNVIFGHAQAEPDLHGMGTTMVAALVRGDLAVIGHVGDSRAYLLRGGALQRLTADHSWVAEQVRRGEITEEEAATSTYRNVLTRSVGVGEGVAPEISAPVVLQPGDVLLLCSDGLHGVVDDDTITRYVESADPAPAAEQLIDLANERGGPDNITVVIGRVAGSLPAAPAAAALPITAVNGGTPAPAPASPVGPPLEAEPATRSGGVHLAMVAGAGALLALALIGGVVLAMRRDGGKSAAPATMIAPVAASETLLPAGVNPPPAPPATARGEPLASATVPIDSSVLARLLPPLPDLKQCEVPDGAPGRPPAQMPCKFTPMIPMSDAGVRDMLGVTADCLVVANPDNQSLRVSLASGGPILLQVNQPYRIVSAEACQELLALGLIPGLRVSPTPSGGR